MVPELHNLELMEQGGSGLLEVLSVGIELKGTRGTSRKDW